MDLPYLNFISTEAGGNKGSASRKSGMHTVDCYCPGRSRTTSLKITMPANSTKPTNAS